MNIDAINTAVASAINLAKNVTEQYVQSNYHGACGFAWIVVNDVRSNSKLGKALINAGFYKSTPGLKLWNPSNHPTQSMDALYSGAEAAAKYLSDELGIDVVAYSRID